MLLKRSILIERIARRGHHIVREYGVDPFEASRVGEVMARPAKDLPGNMSVGETIDFFTAPDAPPRHKSYPVTDELGRLVGVVSRADALRWMMDKVSRGGRLVEQLAVQELVVGYEDRLVGQLADRMAETGKGRVPILRRADGALVGLVARRDLLHVRASAIQHEHKRETLIRFGSSPSVSVTCDVAGCASATHQFKVRAPPPGRGQAPLARRSPRHKLGTRRCPRRTISIGARPSMGWMLGLWCMSSYAPMSIGRDERI